MLQETALEILKTGANVFLTGEPGSGKTHTINRYVSYLRARGIEPAVTASTGIAATHLGGMTIHSWSGLGIKTRLSKYELDKLAFTEYLNKRISRAKVLIIDEISMLGPEMVATVEAVCREIKDNTLPFGGLQVIFVGDFFQLPPVVRNKENNDEQEKLFNEPKSRFAFHSSVWNQANLFICYLTEQFRQDDDKFLEVLSAIRHNVFNDQHLQHLIKRQTEAHLAPKGVPKLFSHNVNVDKVNEEELAKISGEEKEFIAHSYGARPLVETLQKGCLSPERLCLKIGAVVMFTKNNLREGFVNGTLGRVESFGKGSNQPIVRTKDGKRIEVTPMDWTIEENGRLKASITQFPLRLAWAITVHKSQGMSLDEAVMDLSAVFEYGQGYVALSRVRRLTGLHLLGWNEQTFQVHPEVLLKDKAMRLDSEVIENAFISMLPEELKTMQRNFILASGGRENAEEITEKVKKNNKKGETHNETLKLWQSGKKIAEIAKERGLTEQTILSHIEKLVTKGKINRADLKSLISAPLLHALPRIQEVFAKLGTEKLAPVFARFGGEYSYNDLRLARMMSER
ncbi:MAG: AAA ATPase [Candidatus Magasanikbacteria bacterium GW2011_GWC2_37_14]|uniref:AAA ATPase n=1 Tax=Candidatus Magasanikbacteria bacterium GW2011_GWC2_37_14 TaxID=1619046 RepID=A0A0G0GCX1_9BACT|nr:MAG: AAA ATPase [Candidatus Magasanikbacteria bacterium GW2011_GWC2_37_14]